MAGLQVFGSQLTFLLMFTFCKYQLHWINAECDVQAFVEADGEADLDVYRAVIRWAIYVLSACRTWDFKQN